MGPGQEEPDRPSWLDVDDLEPAAPTARSSRTGWLLAGATLPWLVVAVLLLRPPDAAEPPLAGAEASPTQAATVAPGGPEEPGRTASASDEVAAGATILSSGGLVAVDEDEARAVAVLAARRWLTTVGPDAASPAPPHTSPDGSATVGWYAEHLVVEGVDHPAPGAAVVTVRALVLRVAGDTYERVEVRRVAVPLRFDAGGASPAGDPYLLPVDDPPHDPLESTAAIDDPELLLLAGEALAEAGFAVAAVHTLHRTASWPLVVTADVEVGDAPTRTVAVWLRPHLGRLVVAGTRPRRPEPRAPGAHPPADLPSSPDADPAPEEVAP